MADACPWGDDQVMLSWGGRAESLLAELRKRPTRRLLFAGHADAPSPLRRLTSSSSTHTCSRERLLGFTHPGGRIAPFDTDAFVGMLSHFFPGSASPLIRQNACNATAGFNEGSEDSVGGGGSGARSGGSLPTADTVLLPFKVLQLIFLNGCHSEVLARKLYERGAEVVVCWRTACRDDAARLFSVRFFRALASLSAQGSGVATEAASQSDLEAASDHAKYVRAFDEAVAGVRAVKRRTRQLQLKFEFADMQAPGAKTRHYPLAAGIPILLCKRAALYPAVGGGGGADLRGGAQVEHHAGSGGGEGGGDGVDHDVRLPASLSKGLPL